MRIAVIGKFKKVHDEEYIARSFEMLGHEILRVSGEMNLEDALGQIIEFRPRLVIYFKLNNPGNITDFLSGLKAFNIKSICWVFDLYFDYPREFRLKGPQFKADCVFSTDSGHDNKFKELGINHNCVRQGIYRDECYLLPPDSPRGVVFVGSANPHYPERTCLMERLAEDFEFTWYGKKDTDAVRGDKLNELFSKSKIVVGDSVYSPNYWSNRIVETLGRGGFLIHRDVPGLKEEYPYLVTYNGTYQDLKSKIQYYLTHEDERREIVRKNFDWVKDRYTMDKKCAELLTKI